MQIIISPENAAPLTKHCELIGWTPEELANHLLTEPLDCLMTRAADSSNDSAARLITRIRLPRNVLSPRSPRLSRFNSVANYRHSSKARFMGSNSMPGILASRLRRWAATASFRKPAKNPGANHENIPGALSLCHPGSSRRCTNSHQGRSPAFCRLWIAAAVKPYTRPTRCCSLCHYAP